MTCILGLSGGIGSGKSTVTRILAELGATTIDADAIVHEQQAPGQPLLEKLAEAFGADILRPDGSLDREALGAIVFRDEEARTRLGAMMHPPVIAEMGRRAKAAVEAGDALVVLDIPLLFEGRVNGRGSGSSMDFHATVCVWAAREIQIERTTKRDDCDVEEAVRRVAAQLPIDEKRDMADHVIDNTGSVEETRKQVIDLVRHLTQGKLPIDAEDPTSGTAAPSTHE
ncbi:MAG TPA: dephospho-CoA kinase [Myxococcales bacterium]|nr:dephospho-CoA kinase [Myxococcales bacterium]HIK86204.1 dephospho-CoA kinase [Myxococcales bacterium]